MKRLRCTTAVFISLAAVFLLEHHISAESAAQEFTEEDRLIFGIFPVWGFLLLLAGIVMAAVILIVEIFKRKMK